MTDITELAQQELSQLRAGLSNQAIGSKDKKRKIALSLVDKLEKCRDREIRWLALSEEKSKIITDQEEALEKAQKRISRLESRSVKLPKAMSIEGGAYCSAHAHYDSDGDYYDRADVEEMLSAAGIKLEDE